MKKPILKNVKKLMFLLTMFVITNATAQNFKTVWRTTTANESITIPTTVGSYNYTVDWGDGTIDAAQTGNATHTYAAAGDYTVTISGTFPRIYFNNTGDKQKIRSIEEWGSSIAWTSMSNAFRGCTNLVNNATDVPDLSNVVYMTGMFRNCSKIGTGSATNWNSWNVSNVKFMVSMFDAAISFNKNISNWDVSSVVNMSLMFNSASSFNQNIGGWNVANVTVMNSMFSDAANFNQDIGNWNVANNTDFSGMFFHANDFNQDIGDWNVANGTDFSNMFASSQNFNQDIGNWNVENGTDFSKMFASSLNFNQDIGNWNVANGTDFSDMFFYTTDFDQDISNWNVENATNMTGMFKGVKLSVTNYDALLIAWNNQNLQNGVSFQAGDSQYCSSAALAAKNNMIATKGWTINDDGENCAKVSFITTWKTDNAGSSSNTSITIPTLGTVYNYDIDWDNDGTFDQIGVTGDVTHDFGIAGTYTIAIRGSFPGIYFNNTGDKEKILSVEQWGKIAWTSMANAFHGCTNLVNNATDVPDLSSVTYASSMFYNCTNIGTGSATNWNNWDVSNIKSMWLMFKGATSFNKNLSNWNVTNVTNMNSMFSGAANFNQDISGWNVTNVKNMNAMFSGAADFNQDISGWNVTNVTTMAYMFSNATNFNQNIGDWDVSNVTSMSYMFNNAASFNQNIGNWNIGNVNTMDRMFMNASSFNQDIGNWNLSNAPNVYAMFKSATSFNQDIGSWNVSNITNFGEMLSGAIKFDQDISNWNIENATSLSSFLFGVKLSTSNYEALLIAWNNQNLQNGVTFHAGNSQYCSSAALSAKNNMIATKGWTINDGGENCVSTYFVTTWKTDNAGTSSNTSITIPTTGAGYNYDIDWDNDGTFDQMGVTGNVTHDYGTPGTYTVAIRGDFPRIYFNNAGDKQKILSIEQWGEIAWTSMEDAFEGCANLVNNATDVPNLSNVTSMEKMFRRCTNIGTGTANNWNDWDLSNVTNISSLFSNAYSFNKNISNWNVANITDMSGLFSSVSSFNQDLSGWNVAKVTDMSSMFSGASLFNQNISGWNVSEVTSMSAMFSGASLFNQNISNWDVSKVTTMYYTFRNAAAFNQDISNWNVAAVTDMTDLLFGTNLSIANYDALLISWNALTLQNSVSFHGGNSKYQSQAAADARANMMASDNWTITDGGRVVDMVWTGTTNTDWNTATNWDINFVPLNHNNVSIPSAKNPIIGNTTGATVNNLDVDANATLTINHSGSLIVNGASTGEVTYKVSVADTNWHLISSPVEGEKYNDAWNTVNSINVNGTGNNTGVSTYDNTTTSVGTWNYYQKGSADANFVASLGYSLIRTTPGDYHFTGKVADASSISLINLNVGNQGTPQENRWNLVGNRFSAYIKAGDLIAENESYLTDTHEFVYVWDNSLNAGNGAYTALTATDYIHPGQAFFVHASSNNTFSSPRSLQSHQTGVTFYKAEPIPTIELLINDGTNSKFTEIVYQENATTGLDRGFDAGTFTGTSTAFSVYTHLVSDSQGVDFMRQALPNTDYENMVIPIGVNANAGKEITFTAKSLNLPATVKVFLEDKLTNTFTRLDEENNNYKVTLSENTNGIGRFYLHTRASALSTDTVIIKHISIYKKDNTTLRITGISEGKATLKLYNILGKQFMNTTFSAHGVKDIRLPKVVTGVYVVQLETETGTLNKKIILE